MNGRKKTEGNNVRLKKREKKIGRGKQKRQENGTQSKN
jgi:hypothetical protein